jgi:hypothetical protein
MITFIRDEILVPQKETTSLLTDLKSSSLLRPCIFILRLGFRVDHISSNRKKVSGMSQSYTEIIWSNLLRNWRSG